MPTNTLTDARCRAAKPTERAYKLFDGGGLYLFVSPKGARVWRLAYRYDGAQRTKSLGPYPDVSLADARAARDAEKTALRSGIDPMAARRAMRVRMTFTQAREAYWTGRQDASVSYRANAERALMQHIEPRLGARDVGSITREELLDALMTLNAAGKYAYVRKTRMWAGQVFDWAVEHGHASINPAALIRPEKAFGRRAVAHFAALELTDVPGLIERVRLERELQSVLAMWMLAFTWVRTNELRMMEWAEIDAEVRLWRIPKGKMKRARDHVVPLCEQALVLLAKLRARSRGSAYVFAAENRIDRPMSENSVLYLLHRIGYKGRMTGHGFRTLASTWANERGYNRDAIERQLAHAPDDDVRAAYNRAEYLAERRAMLQAWADWLESGAALGVV